MSASNIGILRLAPGDETFVPGVSRGDLLLTTSAMGRTIVVAPSNCPLPLFVNHNGGVGIGTRLPGKALDVMGDVRARMSFFSDAPMGVPPIVVASSNMVQHLNANYVGNMTSAELRDLGNATGILSVTRGGTGMNVLGANKVLVGNGTQGVISAGGLHWDGTRLGVGLSNPTEVLDVSGNVRVSGSATVGSLVVTGNAVAKALSCDGINTNRSGTYQTIKCGGVITNNGDVNTGTGWLLGKVPWSNVQGVPLANPDSTNRGIVSLSDSTMDDNRQAAATANAVKKVYDLAVTTSNVLSTRYLALDGGTMTGLLNTQDINVYGKVQAPGADYAEFMPRACHDDPVFSKGDIVGIDVNGCLTSIFSESIGFAIISTDPVLVGNSTRDMIAFEKMGYADCVAFCGQVPVNLSSYAHVGDYIVPIEEEGRISAKAVPTNVVTFEQYRKAIGRVVRIGSDGRPIVIVKCV